ncbi:MAG: hypothetical protein FD176_1619 [Rhodospirillaceae bacterium]|nr:MAG: hypothetical protein FD176_1619 [Rhodospirillaceae bacterium]TNC95642.1 MAG: Uncharacterized protein FD119_2270 [Stygiobacter sp.]
MARHDDVECMSRQLAAIILRNPRWNHGLDDLCHSLRVDAERAKPRHTMMAVAARAEAILRHIAQGDHVSIGRLYFDVLPALPHPLTQAVITALEQPEGALRLLRESGFAPALRKDDTGASFIEIEIPDAAKTICPATRDAIVAAMGDMGEAPMGELRTIH